jgi:hypothetical protein
MVGVEHVQLSLRQSVGITLKLLLQRKDDVDEVDDVLIAHERLNDGCSPSLSRHTLNVEENEVFEAVQEPLTV